MVRIPAKKEVRNAVIDMIKKLENLFNEKIETLSCIYRNTVKWVRFDGGEECIGDFSRTGSSS